LFRRNDKPDGGENRVRRYLTLLLIALIMNATSSECCAFWKSSVKTEQLEQKLENAWKDESTAIKQMRPNRIVRDKMISIHNFNKDPEFIYDRSSFECDGMIVRIVWFNPRKSLPAIEFLDVTKRGRLPSSISVDVGFSEKEILKRLGKPSVSRKGNLIYYTVDDAKNEIITELTFYLDNRKTVRRIKLERIIEIEPLR